MTDFPMPESRCIVLGFSCLTVKYDCSFSAEYPSHLSSAQFQEYIESYARHFDLLKDIVFGASITRVTRNVDNTRWCLEMLVNGQQRTEEFDKVVFCHGYQTKPVMPKYEGQEIFDGRLMHAQQFRRYFSVSSDPGRD
jgi:dimethylaniline monooxygenase (N-oxide forming)